MLMFAIPGGKCKYNMITDSWCLRHWRSCEPEIGLDKLNLNDFEYYPQFTINNVIKFHWNSLNFILKISLKFSVNFNEIQCNFTEIHSVNFTENSV